MKGATRRSPGGGHSERYEKRRMARGSTRRYGPEWTDSAASGLLEQLEADCATHGRKISQHTLGMLRQPTAWRALPRRAARMQGMSKPDTRLALTALEHYAERLAEADGAGDDAGAKKVVHAFLKPLRERRGLRADLGVLRVAPVMSGPRTFAGWLSREPQKDRHRPIGKCQRILTGLAEWYPRWLKQPGVVCYERATV